MKKDFSVFSLLFFCILTMCFMCFSLPASAKSKHVSKPKVSCPHKKKCDHPKKHASTKCEHSKPKQPCPKKETKKCKIPDCMTIKSEKLKLPPPTVFGVIQLDGAIYNWDNTRLGSGTILRRGRLGAKGNSPIKNWKYNLYFEWARANFEVVYAYLQYIGFPCWEITIGQSKGPYSLEDLTDVAFTTFLERGLPNAFVHVTPINIKATTYGYITAADTYTAGAAIFGRRIGRIPPNEADEGGGLMGRVTYAHVANPRTLFEAGISGSAEKPDSNRVYSISSRPESNVTNATLVNTGSIENSNYWGQYDLEASTVLGPFSLQGEYTNNNIRRIHGLSTLNFNGWYGFASWFLTGESRKFDTKYAVYDRIKPCGKYGAFELAARLSSINLNDNNIRGGYEKNATVGLNWYVNPYVRFLFNYIKVHAVRQNVVDNPNVYTIRAQIDF